MLVIPLFGLMIILMLMQVRVPIGQQVTGQVLGEHRLSLRERMLVQRRNLYAMGLILLLGTLGGWVTYPLELVVIAIAFAILLVPARYLFTSEGVALNNVLFRRWADFENYAVQGTRIRLNAPGRFASYSLFVSPSRQPEVLKLLKKYVKKVHRGERSRPAKVSVNESRNE